MTKFSKECPSAAFIFMYEDDENVSQIKYLYELYKTIKTEKTFLEFVPGLRLEYDDQCQSTWGGITDKV